MPSAEKAAKVAATDNGGAKGGTKGASGGEKLTLAGVMRLVEALKERVDSHDELCGAMLPALNSLLKSGAAAPRKSGSFQNIISSLLSAAFTSDGAPLDRGNGTTTENLVARLLAGLVAVADAAKKEDSSSENEDAAKLPYARWDWTEKHGVCPVGGVTRAYQCGGKIYFDAVSAEMASVGGKKITRIAVVVNGDGDVVRWLSASECEKVFGQ